jgi:RNA polymerase sigma factor (sigma-70 family)
MIDTQPHRELPDAGECSPAPLAERIDELLRDAAPRLLRLARSQQIAPDALDDVVQETLLEAWRSLDHLRDATRFAAWVDGICRNVCRRYRRKSGILRAHEAPAPPDVIHESQPDAFAELADPGSFDPAEELTRQDRLALLDRALGFIPPESRVLVERHYLAEIPQRELAAQVGLTQSALASRLHRARAQILHALSHELRAETVALGLAVTAADAMGWRETRIWCVFCGRQRMLGMFEPMGDGRINLRLRCPFCASFEANSLGMVPLAHARSFLPATKKMIDESGRFVAAAMAAGGACRCWVCGRQTHLRVVRDDALSPQTWLMSACGCLRMAGSAPTLYGAHPQVRQFLFGSDRLVIGPELETTYAGQRATRFSLLSPGDGRRQYIFADARSLAPLAVIIE